MTTAVAHVATVAAYPIKDELGGGFRGVYKAIGGERHPSPEAFATLEEAKFWAKSYAWRLHEGCTYAVTKTRGEYRANVWLAVN